MVRGKVALISSVYGGYDQPVPLPQQDIDCEYVLVSDREYNTPGWRTVIEHRPGLHPRLAAKVAKCRPDLYADADYYIWLDTSFQIGTSDFASWCIKELGDNLIAQIVHPERSRILDESLVSRMMAKYQGLPVVEQAMYYIDQGYPDGFGLWATGLRVQRNDPLLKDFGDAWLREQVRWTYQDQISQPYLLWKMGISISGISCPLWHNGRFQIRSHASHL